MLPEGSYYTSIKDIIGHESEEIPFAISPEQFAQGVLREVERGTAGKVWMAGGALMARIALWILPEWAIVSCSLDDNSNTTLMVAGVIGSNVSEHEAAVQHTTDGRAEEACLIRVVGVLEEIWQLQTETPSTLTATRGAACPRNVISS